MLVCLFFPSYFLEPFPYDHDDKSHLNTMTRTTRSASPMPATTGPTTQTRLVRDGWDGIKSQSTSSQ